jgi:hypothetical protein
MKGINYFGYLDLSGYELSRYLEREAINDCSASGSVDSAVQYWVDKLKFNFDAKKGREYLKGLGAWDDDELNDHEQNRHRMLWVVCCDINDKSMHDDSDHTWDDSAIYSSTEGYINDIN